MLSELALSALTDVLLASFQAFAAGVLFRPGLRSGSPARLWAWAMMLTAVTFLAGAIDHGFYEPIAHPFHPLLMSVNRALVAVVSFLFVMTAATQFLGPVARKAALIVAGLVAAMTAVLVFLSDNFFIVIGCYSTALIFVLLLNLLHLREGKGAVPMIAGIVVTFAASAIPLVGWQVGGLGVYATYHVALMPAVVAFCLAGFALDAERPSRLS